MAPSRPHPSTAHVAWMSGLEQVTDCGGGPETTWTGSIDFVEIVYVHSKCVPPLHLTLVSRAKYVDVGGTACWLIADGEGIL